VFPEFIKPQEQLFPIKALKIKYSKNYELNHRDFLGSLMALQIKREVIGDIVVSEDCAVVFVREDIAQFIITNLKKIGNVGVSVDYCDGTQVVKKQEFTQIKGTVSSMRLDCIVSLLMNKSRTNAVSAINARMVKVNANECENVSFTVKEHDVIAIKGYGKFIVKEEITKTKKGKLFISVDKYL
ncbi:MAG: YlmH/Sll1252 family protein, partial [Oscillospiraceae bacterium]